MLPMVSRSVLRLLAATVLMEIFMELCKDFSNASAACAPDAIAVFDCLDPLLSWVLSQEPDKRLSTPPLLDETIKLIVLALRGFLANALEDLFG